MKSIEFRGKLTNEIKFEAEKYLNREFTQKELRLYPYLQYVFVNGSQIDRRKIDLDEWKIIDILIKEGRILCQYPNYYYPSTEFWKFMNEVILKAYVISKEEIENEKF